MEASILSALSDFSVPAISVLVIAYMLIKTNESRESNTRNFLQAMEQKRQDDLNVIQSMRLDHEGAMKEIEQAFRALEKDVRERILTALIDSTRVISESARTMERVLNHMDAHH